MKPTLIKHDLSPADLEKAQFIFNLQQAIGPELNPVDIIFSDLMKSQPVAKKRARLVKLGGHYLNGAYQRHVIISRAPKATALFLDLFNWWLFLRFEMKYTFVQVSRLFEHLELTAPKWEEIKSAFRKLDTLYSDYLFRFRKLDFSDMENWQKSAQSVLVQPIRQSFSRGMRESVLNAPFNEVIGIHPVLAHTTAEELVANLEAEHIPARLSRRTEHGVICQRHAPLYESKAYKNNLFTFVDEADELFLELIFPYMGQNNCIIENLSPSLSAVMNDLFQYETKLEDAVNGRPSNPDGRPVFKSLVLPENDKRPQFAGDLQKFDSITITASDSQCGFISQNPLLKYCVTEDFVERHCVAAQKQLEFAASIVNKNGYLIFYSHSVLPIETELVILDFLSRHSEFKPQRLNDELLQNYNRKCFTPNGFTTAPYLKQMNGFYLSVMQKHNN